MTPDEIYASTREAVDLNPHDYSYAMGCLLRDGIGCNKDLRLARKYLEDAHSFGDPRAAGAIADLYEAQLAMPGLPEWEQALCRRQAQSWRRLIPGNK